MERLEPMKLMKPTEKERGRIVRQVSQRLREATEVEVEETEDTLTLKVQFVEMSQEERLRLRRAFFEALRTTRIFEGEDREAVLREVRGYED